MKRYIFLFVALLCCVSTTAQVVFVATLQHESTTTQYYGQDALTSAYSAAVDGDVITLSDGTFQWNAGTFNKSITLRGAGNITQDKRTIVVNNFTLVTRNKEMKTQFEGIYFNNTIVICNEDSTYEKGKIEFVKCRLKYISCIASEKASKNSPKVNIYNCVIDGNIAFHSPLVYPKYNILNSYINEISAVTNLGINVTTFKNCVIRMGSAEYYDNGYYYYQTNYLNFYNCIMVCRGSRLPITTTVINCLGVTFDDGRSYYVDNLFEKLVSGQNNMKAPGNKPSVFKTYTDGCGTGETFELTDKAKTKYLGDDGTQVGMQGGLLPFNTTVSYPIITNYKADVSTTKEGNLNIEVEVDGK